MSTPCHLSPRSLTSRFLELDAASRSFPLRHQTSEDYTIHTPNTANHSTERHYPHINCVAIGKLLRPHSHLLKHSLDKSIFIVCDFREFVGTQKIQIKLGIV